MNFESFQTTFDMTMNEIYFASMVLGLMETIIHEISYSPSMEEHMIFVRVSVTDITCIASTWKLFLFINYMVQAFVIRNKLKSDTETLW